MCPVPAVFGRRLTGGLPPNAEVVDAYIVVTPPPAPAPAPLWLRTRRGAIVGPFPFAREEAARSDDESSDSNEREED